MLILTDLSVLSSRLTFVALVKIVGMGLIIVLFYL